MRKSDLNYISKIPGVKSKKVGKLLSSGVHHRVYEYSQRWVIKVPRRRFNFLYSKRSHLEADLKHIGRHFPGLVVPTKIFSSSNKSRHCIVQEKIQDALAVTPEQLEKVQREFDSLLDKNRQLIKREHLSLDFLGGDGFYSCFFSLFNKNVEPYFSNMLIVRGKGKRKYRLKLIDTELLRFGWPKLYFSEIVGFVLSVISLWITKACLKVCFQRSLS